VSTDATAVGAHSGAWWCNHHDGVAVQGISERARSRYDGQEETQSQALQRDNLCGSMGTLVPFTVTVQDCANKESTTQRMQRTSLRHRAEWE
jgi:hypothetical protein